MIAAIVLAAGGSSRMGQPKMALPWGETTVLGRVIHVMKSAKIEDILIVTGAAREAVEGICRDENVRMAFNLQHAANEMLGSLQAGLRDMVSATDAALIALGDQPQIQEDSIRRVVEKHVESNAPLVVPSFRMRRGHPWLVGRPFWEEILGMSRSSARETSYCELSAHFIWLETKSSSSVIRILGFESMFMIYP